MFLCVCLNFTPFLPPSLNFLIILLHPFFTQKYFPFIAQKSLLDFRELDICAACWCCLLCCECTQTCLFMCASLHESSVCVCVHVCVCVCVCVFENTIIERRGKPVSEAYSAAVWPTMGPITSLLIHKGTSLTLLCRESQCNSLSFVSQWSSTVDLAYEYMGEVTIAKLPLTVSQL